VTRITPMMTLITTQRPLSVPHHLKQMSLELLKRAVKKAPGFIYRLKGLMLSTEASDRRVILQAVGKRVDIAIGDHWGNRTPRTRVVAIGAKGAVHESTLEAMFNYSDDD